MQKIIENLLKKTPGLKAKEIAKKVGKERKSVNSFLYSHKDIFTQDDNFCWFLVTPQEQILELNTYWVTADSFEKSLSQVGCLLESSSESVLVKIPEGCKIMLNASARLLALLNQLIFIGKKVTVDLTCCANIKSFFNRDGFFDQLSKDVNIIPERPKISAAEIYKGNSSALVEFGPIDPKNENKELIGQLGERFVQQSNVRYEVAALTVFGELIGNVTEHSDSKINGFAALQKYGGNKKHIQTVVSDSGLGIAKTLRPSLKQYYPKLYNLYKEENVKHDADLVKTVLSTGGISRFGAGRGLGFKSSCNQAMKFDAELSVRQERFCLNFTYKNGVLVNVESLLNLPKILGTHLCFDFFVDPV
ncbi:MAG: hypothetical protein PHI97_16310 [Desulfobulbus sp.]|nr:hypothetical protein [Desulfobulbus sp.]